MLGRRLADAEGREKAEEHRDKQVGLVQELHPRTGNHSWNFIMTSSSSLCPGYQYVEAFGPDEEYESEEEVCYVTLDLGDVEPTLVPSSKSYRMIVQFSCIHKESSN